MTLAAVLGAVLLMVALRADNVLAHGEDTDVCVEDSAHRSIGKHQMYVSSTHSHVVVRPVSDVSVISIENVDTPFDYLGHHIEVTSGVYVFMITYTVTSMPGVLEVCFEDDLGFLYPIAMSDGSSNNNGGTDNPDTSTTTVDIGTDTDTSTVDIGTPTPAPPP